MRILVLGSGAREHAIAWKLTQDPTVTYVICAPGNPGIARTVATAPLDILDTDAVIRFVDQQQIDLTVVGPEAPLGRGLVNRFEAEGREVFGPTQGAAQLETSTPFLVRFFGSQTPDRQIMLTLAPIGVGPSMLGYHIRKDRKGANKPFRFKHLTTA